MWTFDHSTVLPLWRTASTAGAPTLAFSTRRGGVSMPPFESLNLGRSTEDEPANVAENRNRLLSSLGLSSARLATAGQVHGAVVAEVSAPGHTPECDALVTTTPGLALAVTTADCMSLLYHAPGALAAAHAGWRGVAAGMPLAALSAVRARSASGPERLTVHFGPCIRGCCYEVGEDVAARFPAEAVRTGFGRPRLDLPTAARMALLTAGVPEECIFDTGACTSCEPHWYFSHRRDAGRTGRHWGVAALAS